MTLDPFTPAPAATGKPVLEIREEGNSRWMPDPLTGKIRRFTRASSWGGTISDDHMLTEWKLAMATMGVAKNHDLYALANAARMPEEDMEYREKGWWKKWADIGHMAMDRIGYQSGAHLGTAFHEWKEQIEDGTIILEEIPRRWRPHMLAFLRMHKVSGLKYHQQYTETLIVNTKLHNGVCGRLDNLRGLPSGLLMVDDTKTGRNAPMGMDEIAVQLAVYAHADYIWAPNNPEAVHGYIPMPEGIEKRFATISWVPIDNPDKAQIIPVDIEWGWEAAQAIAWVRSYLNRSKRKNDNLQLPLSVLADGPERGTIASIINSEPKEPLSVFNISAQIEACTALDELSNVIFQAAYHDRWTPELEKLAYARQKALRGGFR